MKLLIASDIHGSAHWCEKLLKRFEAEKADKLVLLGDVLYHGPRNPLPDGYAPKQVFEMLNSIADKIIAVRGNCDSEVDQMVLDFNVSSDYAEIFDGNVKLTISHGHRLVPPLGAGDVYITGHTHVPLDVVEEGGYRHLNPGSVSLPKENSPHGYITYENATFTFKDLEGKAYDCRKI
ncbi:MAG: phosphodiesterase [Clostridia bacterium]|nr:phosphodiesterase [Clostridia bacterium]